MLCSNLSKLELDGKIKVVTHQRFLNYDAVVSSNGDKEMLSLLVIKNSIKDEAVLSLFKNPMQRARRCYPNKLSRVTYRI